MYLQMIVTVELPEQADHKRKMEEMLEQIPEEGDFADVTWALDGSHLDDEGDPL